MARGIDPYSLRLFLAAAREGSIARAAATEHIAASALSRRIADLERAFGVPLFVRSPHGIALTEAGKVAMARGTKLEDDLNLLVREVQAHAGEICGLLRLFANATAIVGSLPERLSAFCKKYPSVEIALHEHISEEVVRACLDDRADIGVGVQISVPNALQSWHFDYDPLLVILPLDHPLAAKRKLRMTDLGPYPLVSIRTGGALDRLLHDRALESNVPVRTSVTVTSFDAVCRMVEAGLGIAVIPRRAADAFTGKGRLVRRTLDEPWINRDLRVYALSATPRLPAVQALIEALRADPAA
ncbi:MAG TPA: LysR family transcriptional regulator [Burkholderiales bacterium]|nr:LysR family transcriptional regulator [Burkholderiales bacterium]